MERQYGEYAFVHVKTPSYKGNGLKRMYSIWAFAHWLYRNCRRFERPDIVLHNIHPPFDYPVVRMAKKLHARYVAEAWDLWPEDFATFGLISRKNPLLKLAYQVEKRYYTHADQIVFTFEGAFSYLKHQGWTKEQGGSIDLERVHYINSGVDLDKFDHDRITYQRKDAELMRTDCFKIVYLGSINRANHVQTLVDAAKILQKDNNYQVFIYGNGAFRDELEQYARNQQIDNVHFMERHIPFEEVAWVVSQSTVNVMNYEQGFGHLGVSSGKLFQYLAAGKPIVCNINIAYDDVITNNNLGIARDMLTAEDLAIAIRIVAEQPKANYDGMCERVRQTAGQFDYKQLAAREIEVLKAACR